jgi:alpha-mannosidase
MESINEQCEKFHYPLLAVRRKNTEELKLEDSLLALSPKTAVLSAIKESDDMKAMVVRWWNPTSKEAAADLQLNFLMKRAVIAKLNEEEIRALPSQQKQTINTAACGITTVRTESS